MRKIKMLLTVLLLIVFTGCDNSINNNLVVYVTNYPLQYIVESIGQDLIDTYTIYDNLDTFDSESGEEFVYSAQPRDSITLSDEKQNRILESDLFIFSQLQHEKNAVLQIIDSQKSEDLHLYDITEFFSSSNKNSSFPLVYNDTIINSNLHDVIEQDELNSYFWISPTDTLIVAGLIKDLLIEKIPNKQTELEKNYESLRYTLLSLSAELDRIQSDTTNNVVVSDSNILDGLNYYYIQNVSTDFSTSAAYKNSTTEEYNLALAEYINIEQPLVISTTNPSSPYYFNPLFTLTNEQYAAGSTFETIMLNNYLIIETILKG